MKFKDLNQLALVDGTGIPRYTVSDVILGRTRAKPEDAKVMAAWLQAHGWNVTAEDLYFGYVKGVSPLEGKKCTMPIVRSNKPVKREKVAVRARRTPKRKDTENEQN